MTTTNGYFDTDEQTAGFVKSVLELLTPDGHGKRELDMHVLAEVVRKDPDSAAAVVSAISRTAEIPSMIAQLAIAIATVYRIEFQDDSLDYEISSAPWYGKFSQPQLKQNGEPDRPDPLHIFLREESKVVKALDVDQHTLATGNIDAIVRALSVSNSPADVSRSRRQSQLWGNCLLMFSALDNDPRAVYVVPEARQFVANLHAAMPYFPCYLNFRPEAGMFVVYFGSQADQEALMDDGISVDILHHSVLQRVKESLVAIRRVAEAIDKDPRPIWRTMLSVYSESTRNDLMKEVGG